MFADYTNDNFAVMYSVLSDEGDVKYVVAWRSNPDEPFEHEVTYSSLLHAYQDMMILRKALKEVFFDE